MDSTITSKNDFKYSELSAEPYWNVYGWMTNELGLSGDKLIVFSLLYERDCRMTRGDEITGGYIVKCVNSSGRKSHGRRSGGASDCSLDDVFKLIAALAGDGLVEAAIDEKTLTTVYRCNEDMVMGAVAAAREAASEKDNDEKAQNDDK